MLTMFSLDLAGWPSFDPKWLSFEVNLKNIKTNILSRIHDDYFKNVTSTMLIRFFFDLTWWPSFWPQVTQFQTWPGSHQDKILSKIHYDYLENVTSSVLTRFSFDFAQWLSVLTSSDPVLNNKIS